MKYILSSLLTFLALALNAQTIQDVIRTMPDDVIIGLSSSQKEKLCTPGKDSIKIANVLNGEMIRLDISADYINLQTSEIGTTQIKILPLINDSKILCVVKTVCSKVCDSYIQFYTTDWKLLPNQNLLPTRSFDWFIKPEADRQSDDYKEAMKAVDMNPVVFDLSTDDYSLTASSEIYNYIASDDLESLTPYLKKKPTVFVWDKISFKEKQ